MNRKAFLSPAATFRTVMSLVAAEGSHHSGGRVWNASGWTTDTSLGPEGLALDSLELTLCAEVVSRFFRLHESGDENRLLAESTLGGWRRIVSESFGKTDGFTFATSGTTGYPKLCRQSMDVLFEEASCWSEQFAGCTRIIQTVPAHHIYGFLFAVLLPDITGWPVLDVRATQAGALRGTLRPTDLLIGFPTGLSNLLRAVSDLPPGLHIVSATARLSPEIHRALLSRGAGEVTDIYGSTETGGVARRLRPDEPFELLPRWRQGDSGAITDIATGQSYPLPDRVSWESDRLLRLAERVDGAVQVGGVNVFPASVAERLRRHPLVADCTVFLDETLPEPRLRAVIVPAPGHDPEVVIAACDHWSRRKFPSPERPVAFEARASADGAPAGGDRPS